MDKAGTTPAGGASGDGDRRTLVLRAAMSTFARFGYRKTSMDLVAQAADISRPGLYFLFSSKESLFREAVTLSLQEDLAAAQLAVTAVGRPLQVRLLNAFDQWAGRYIGPLARDVASVVEDKPDLLGSIVEAAPMRFAQLITEAIAVQQESAAQVAQTLISASLGIKHQVGDRSIYLQRLAIAINLLVPPTDKVRGG